jgi:hypothetical protein
MTEWNFFLKHGLQNIIIALEFYPKRAVYVKESIFY